MVARSTPRRLLWASLVAVVVGLTTNAGAFCRSRTCEFNERVGCRAEDSPSGVCSTVGEFVRWPDACITYAIQREGSPLRSITAEQLAPLIEEGFRAWSAVTCSDGNTPPIAAASQGTIACDKLVYSCSAGDQNSNLFVFRDTFEDSPSGLNSLTLGLTTLTVDVKTGEILDADVEFNSRDYRFVLEEPANPTDPEAGRDLQGVVTHEIGHLLGLSHSDEVAALMRVAYVGREPLADDQAGICATYGSAAGDPACSAAGLLQDAACLEPDRSCDRSAPADEGGCSCRLPGRVPAGGAGGLAGLLAVALCRLRSARRRRTVL